MKKRYLLLFCLSFLCSHKIWADVGSIQIRLNENMQVVDLSTSAVSTSTIDEAFVQQGGLTTAEENQCTFNQDGTVQEEECTCPGEGVLTPHGNKYVCCENKKIYKGGTYSSYFMPTCGCPDGYSDPWENVSTEKLCCKNGQSCYTELGGTEICENSDACGCPDGSKRYEGYCCDGDGRVLTTTETGVQHYTLCGCAIANPDTRKDYCDADKCAKTQGMTWCEAGVCISEGEQCPCIPGDNDNACSQDSCPTQGGCWINGSCEAQDSDKTCDQRQCEAGGQKWCGEEGCLDQCTCTPGADENGYCTEATCEAANGCWYNGICKAGDKGTCSADRPWDETICACSEPCPRDTQRTAEGDCIPCPTGGEVKGDAGDYVCCDGDKKWYTEGAWSERPNYAKCGCPEGQYLEGNQCFSCTLDTHCSAEGKVCNPASHTCVGCINDDNCSGGQECNAENICACPEGKNWNGSSCVECDGNYGAAATWPCSTTDNPLCNSSGVCEACPDEKPYWHNGRCVECTENDPCSDGVCDTEENTCVPCLTNSDCSTNTNNKYCVNKQCVQCTNDQHCTEGTCEGNRCVVCHQNNDCKGGKVCNTTTNTCACPADKPVWKGSACVTCAAVDPTKPFWDDENDVCVAVCNTTMKQTGNTCQCDKGANSKTPKWDAWRNRCVSCFRANDKKPVWNVETQECEECEYIPGTENTDQPRRKVWDLYNEKCVRCYDSISANWTDLGCGNAEYHSDYDPRQNKGSDVAGRVCKVDAENINNNECVQCIEDSHCPTNKKCKNNTCMECDADYGATTGLRCPNTKPQCSNGVCKACPNDKKYWYNDECVACSIHYGVEGDGYECPENTPYCYNGTCQKCEDVGTKTKKQYGMDKNGTIGCYLCINDKAGESKDTGCTSDNPICPTDSIKGYNVCCPTNAPKWKDGKCVTCAAVDSKKTHWNGSACVQCTEDNHCGAGQYCNNGKCVACTNGTRCGCAEYQCANGKGGCYSQLAWCMKWNANYSHTPSENSACSGYACCNHNSKENKWNGKNPPACKTDTSINGQNRTS